jgi:hypothetical protein
MYPSKKYNRKYNHEECRSYMRSELDLIVIADVSLRTVTAGSSVLGFVARFPHRFEGPAPEYRFKYIGQKAGEDDGRSGP